MDTQESDMEMAVRICGPKTRVFSGGEIQLFATAEKFNELVRALVAKHTGQNVSDSNEAGVDPSDVETAALEWIKSTIASKKANGEYGYVETEVVDEFNMYRKNNPLGSPIDQAKCAMHACAHQ